MLFLSIVLYIFGGLLTILGIVANSNDDLRLLSFLASGDANPGTILIVIGVILLAVATLLLVLHIKKKKNKKQVNENN